MISRMHCYVLLMISRMQPNYLCPQAHDVRYTPLTFDGWRERHWTLPFQGERFSLVWFTPR